VQYTISDEIKSVVNCHCKTCKKITGAAFETIAVIDETSLEVLRGEELLTVYQISDTAKKHFCKNCGTPIYNLLSAYPGRCLVQVGSLDDPSLVSPAVNIFCESMLPWTRDIADMKCFDKLPAV
jgi:hypothetical protein